MSDTALPATAPPVLDPLGGERQRKQRRSLLAAVLVIVALASVPLWSSGSFGIGRFGVAVTYVIAAVGLNLAIGFAGELVLGHAAIMAMSAYGAGILSAKLGWDFVPALAAGIAIGVAFGLVMMSPGLRVRGWYFSLLTLFAVLVMPRISNLFEGLTGGEYGLTGIRPAALFGYNFSGVALFEFAVLCFALIWFSTANFLRSGWGTRLQALRDIPRAAQASGIDLVRTRLTVYILTVNAESFGMGLTLLLLTGVILGGSGTLWGPLVGIAPLIGLSFWVGPFSAYNAIVLGLGLLAGSILFPDGIVVALSRSKAKTKLLRSAPAAIAVDVSAAAAPPSVLPAPAGPAALHMTAKGVAKHFGGVAALDGVDLDLHRGALIGLVGPNGSGKSTLLNMLSGFSAPDSGRIELNGVDVTRWPVHRIAKAGVGRTFQIPQLIDELTAIDNIKLSLIGRQPDNVLAAMLRLPAVARRGAHHLAEAYTAFITVGLPASGMALPVAELPLGLKRIVEVARAIAPLPEILLLDEPAAGLNAEERKTLGNLLRLLRARGMTILLVEHNVPFVTEYCDELVLLEAGAVTARARLDAPLPERLDAYLKYKPTLGAAPAKVGEA